MGMSLASPCQERWILPQAKDGGVVIVISPSVKTCGFASSLVRGSRSSATDNRTYALDA